MVQLMHLFSNWTLLVSYYRGKVNIVMTGSPILLNVDTSIAPTDAEHIWGSYSN